MLPDKNEKYDPDYDSDGNTLAADEIWPMHTEGRKKGQPKAVRDSRGNVVVDPAGNIMRSKYLLDFKIYKALHEYRNKLIN